MIKLIRQSATLLGFAIVTLVFTSCSESEQHTLDSSKHKHVIKPTVSGVPDVLPYAGERLALNGSGFRIKYGVKIYAFGLYTPKTGKDADYLINSNETVGVRLNITSILITTNNLTRVVRDGFIRSTDGKTEAIQPAIDALVESFNNHPVDIGNVYDMVYIPGEGLQGYLDEKPWGPIIECGQDFRSALIGIWLSDDPVDKELKVKLLES